MAFAHNTGAQYRRFAVSIDFNNNFQDCGALHQVTSVIKGKRYALPAFLYGKEDVKKREANNARLDIGETLYTGMTTGRIASPLTP